MVGVGTILACVVSLLISVALPLGVLVLIAVKHKNRGMILSWLLGAAGFFVTQILIRVPIVTVLQTQDWFMDFAMKTPFLYVFSMAFTAGLFELAGRYGVGRILERKLDFSRSLAAGLGHGGIEAIVIAGSAMANNLLFIFMINTGTFDAVLEEAKAAGLTGAQLELTITQLETIREQLLNYAPGMFLLGGYERIMAMTCHAAMSTIVCYGIAHKKVWPCLLICLVVHTLIDLSAGISMLIGTVLTQTTAYLIIYALLTLTAVASLVILRELRRRWKTNPMKEVIS